MKARIPVHAAQPIAHAAQRIPHFSPIVAPAQRQHASSSDINTPSAGPIHTRPDLSHIPVFPTHATPVLPALRDQQAFASHLSEETSHRDLIQRKVVASVRSRRNTTGLPDHLKTGIESLAGMSLDDVQVHYNSSKPAEVNALAYTQGRNIYMGPKQEKHLAHEAWHVVQQKQGRVSATMQAKGIAINDNQGLEHEADVMGHRASQNVASHSVSQTAKQPLLETKQLKSPVAPSHTIQRTISLFNKNNIFNQQNKQKLDEILQTSLKKKLTARMQSILQAWVKDKQDQGHFATVADLYEALRTAAQEQANKEEITTKKREVRETKGTSHITIDGKLKESTSEFLKIKSPPKSTSQKDLEKEFESIWNTQKALFDDLELAKPDNEPLPPGTTASKKGPPKKVSLKEIENTLPVFGPFLRQAIASALQTVPREEHKNEEGKLPVYTSRQGQYSEYSYLTGGGRLVVDTVSNRQYISSHYSEFYRVVP